MGETGVRPGIIGEIGTDKPWVSPAEERVHRAAARAARRTGLAITTHAVLSDVGLAQLRIFEEEGADPARVVIGHADSYPVLDHYLAIIERGANDRVRLPRDVVHADRAARRGPRSSSCCCELLARGHADRILLSQDVCHDSQLTRYEGNGYTYLAETFLPRLRDAGVSRRRDRDDDGREPAAAPDDRLDRRARQPSSVASTLSATLPASATLIGQPSLVASAAATKSAADDAGHAPADRQRARDDPPARLELVEGDLGRDIEALRRRPGPAEGARQRHREAGGVGGRDQLLRARPAVGRLGPGGPR